MPRYLDALLQDQTEHAREFAQHLMTHGDERPDYQHSTPRIADLAMWGIDREEWELVGRAMRLEELSGKLSHRCPALILVPLTSHEDVSHRISIMPGQEIRHQAIEDWLGREMDQHDMATLQEFAHALPAGWMVVLEGRSHHSHDREDQVLNEREVHR